MSEIDEIELEPLPRQSNRDPRLIYQTLADSLNSGRSFQDLPEDHKFHIFMIGELAAAELSAASVYEADEMPWEFLRDMACQCWDEARHAEINYRWYSSGGSALDKYPAVNIYYDIYHQLGLASRLAILCIVDEARALDGQRVRVDEFMKAGDLQRARSTERVMHEEVRHVAYGNRWLEYLSGKRGVSKQTLIEDARRELFALMEPSAAKLPNPPSNAVPPPSPPPIDAELRLRAGFSHAELSDIARQQNRELSHTSPYAAEKTGR